MRIAQFRVQNYKIIDDTGDVPADPNITALVGKNESGKTGILRAIWKSHNVANAKFDRLLDYRRERYAAERKGTEQVVSLTLNLEKADLEALKDQLPSPALDIKQVVLTVSYDGEDKTTEIVSFGHQVEADQLRTSEEARLVVERMATAINSTLGSDDPAIGASRDSVLPRIPTSGRLWDHTVVAALTEFHTAINNWRGQQESRKSLAQAEMGALEKALATAKAGDPLARARKWATDNLPTFIYFDDYGQLETHIHLPTYLQKKSTAEPKIRTQTALFTKASLDPQEILDLGRPKQNETDETVQRRKGQECPCGE